MKTIGALAVVLVLASVASAKIYYSEKFEAGWEQRWVQSKFKEAEGTNGKWEASAGKYHKSASDLGLRTTQDARFYQISSKFPTFDNKDKPLVIQFSVKHEQSIDCGGGYIKLHPEGFDQENYNGDTKYNVMFGPDICGSSTRRVHVIFNHKGENHLITKTIPCETDTFSHVYTLIVRPDNTYAVLIDGKEKEKGSLKEDWNMLAPKQIKDPQAHKPADWVDARQIPDPTDKKPEGWDSIPAEIKDPSATKPEDWDDELDGEWEAPMIDNPEYKGEWKPKMIDNPAYKGEWVHPMIDNPDFHDDNSLYHYPSTAGVGFEIWQVKAGSIFDNVLVTDDIATAEEWQKITLDAHAAESAQSEAEEKIKREKEEEERKKREAEEKDAEKDGHGDDGHDEL